MKCNILLTCVHVLLLLLSQNQLLDASQTLLDSSLDVRGLLHVLLRYQKAGSHLLTSISHRQISVKDVGFYTLATAIPVLLVGSPGIKLGLLGLVLLLYTLEAAVAGASVSLWHIATTLWFDRSQTFEKGGWAAAAAAADAVTEGFGPGVSPGAVHESIKWGLRVFMMVVAAAFVVWRLHAQSAPQRRLAKMVEEVHAEVLRMQYEFAVREATGMGLGSDGVMPHFDPMLGQDANGPKSTGKQSGKAGKKGGAASSIPGLGVGSQGMQSPPWAHPLLQARLLQPAVTAAVATAGGVGSMFNYHHHQHQQHQQHQHQQQRYNERGSQLMGGMFSVPNWLSEQLFHQERNGVVPNNTSSSRVPHFQPGTPAVALAAAGPSAGLLTAGNHHHHHPQQQQQQQLLLWQQQQQQQGQQLKQESSLPAAGGSKVMSDDVSSDDGSQEATAAAAAAATTVAAAAALVVKPRRNSRRASGSSQDAAAGDGGGGGGGKGGGSSRRKRAAGATADDVHLQAVAEEVEGHVEEPKAKKAKGMNDFKQ